MNKEQANSEILVGLYNYRYINLFKAKTSEQVEYYVTLELLPTAVIDVQVEERHYDWPDGAVEPRWDRWQASHFEGPNFSEVRDQFKRDYGLDLLDFEIEEPF